MDVKLLVTDGKGKFTETNWTKPEITNDEIEVKAIFTGVCRSDIDMMTGKFGPLPIHMSGHEGLGQVTTHAHTHTRKQKRTPVYCVHTITSITHACVHLSVYLSHTHTS